MENEKKRTPLPCVCALGGDFAKKAKNAQKCLNYAN
jgi:hypothetical protein